MKYTAESIIILDESQSFEEAWLHATEGQVATSELLFSNGTTTRKRGDSEYDNSNYLTVLDGWNTYAGMTLTTVPKLMGPGSYIESKHLAERELGLSTSVSGSGIEDIEEVVNMLLSLIFTGELVKVFRVLSEGPVVRKIELLEGYIGSVTEWDRLDDDATLTFTVRVLEPIKLYKHYAEDGSGLVTKSGEKL